MAAAVVERGWRDSTPESVEDDLAALWRDIAGNGPSIARAVMANLVVFRFHERRTRPSDEPRHGNDDAIEALIGLHPSRTIVVEHDRGGHDAKPPTSAGVGISVFGSAATRYGVERIVVRSACAEVSLPSIVRRFLRGDRPTSLWWTEDLSRDVPSDALVDLARQLIYDSRKWHDLRSGFDVVAALATSQRVDVADMNWRRLDPIRRALAHAVDGLQPTTPPRLSIRHRPGEAALGWLLAGWLAARLDPPRNGWPSIEESPAGDDIVTLVIDDGATSVTTTLTDDRVHVSRAGMAPIVVPSPREQPAEAMAAELRTLSRDAALADALAAIGRRGVES
jgi:glucose-6-phosphate dehydrogenase assembly protein OpcA